MSSSDNKNFWTHVCTLIEFIIAAGIFYILGLSVYFFFTKIPNFWGNYLELKAHFVLAGIVCLVFLFWICSIFDNLIVDRSVKFKLEDEVRALKDSVYTLQNDNSDLRHKVEESGKKDKVRNIS